MKIRYQMEELVRTAEYESVKFSIAIEEEFDDSDTREDCIADLRKVVQEELAKDVRVLKKKRGIE